MNNTTTTTTMSDFKINTTGSMDSTHSKSKCRNPYLRQTKEEDIEDNKRNSNKQYDLAFQKLSTTTNSYNNSKQPSRYDSCEIVMSGAMKNQSKMQEETNSCDTEIPSRYDSCEIMMSNNNKTKKTKEPVIVKKGDDDDKPSRRRSSKISSMISSIEANKKKSNGHSDIEKIGRKSSIATKNVSPKQPQRHSPKPIDKKKEYQSSRQQQYSSNSNNRHPYNHNNRDIDISKHSAFQEASSVTSSRASQSAAPTKPKRQKSSDLLEFSITFNNGINIDHDDLSDDDEDYQVREKEDRATATKRKQQQQQQFLQSGNASLDLSHLSSAFLEASLDNSKHSSMSSIKSAAPVKPIRKNSAGRVKIDGQSQTDSDDNDDNNSDLSKHSAFTTASLDGSKHSTSSMIKAPTKPIRHHSNERKEMLNNDSNHSGISRGSINCRRSITKRMNPNATTTTTNNSNHNSNPTSMLLSSTLYAESSSSSSLGSYYDFADS